MTGDDPDAIITVPNESKRGILRQIFYGKFISLLRICAFDLSLKKESQIYIFPPFPAEIASAGMAPVKVISDLCRTGLCRKLSKQRSIQSCACFLSLLTGITLLAGTMSPPTTVTITTTKKPTPTEDPGFRLRHTLLGHFLYGRLSHSMHSG